MSAWGQFCSEPCREEFHRRRQQRLTELRAEPLFQAPAELTVPDFETFALKVAVYASLNLDAVQDLPEGLRHPEILALQVKEVLLRHIPEEYVSVWQEGSGWSRQERYSFRKPVPMELVRGAMQQAGFAWRVAWFGSIAERAFFFTDLGSKWRAIRDHIERTIDEHIRAVAETAPDTQLTATLQIDSSVLQPLMTHIERLDEQWRLHHHLAAEGISKASDVSARDALEILGGLEYSLRVLALGPASAD